VEENIDFALPKRDRVVCGPPQPRTGKEHRLSRVSTPAVGATLLLGVCLLAVAWQRPVTGTGSIHPSVEITSVPLAGTDDPAKQIVIYAKGLTAWWVQPFADHPFTKIQQDATWYSSTHPGAEYAALLVGPDFHPPPTSDLLPSEGVIASAVVRGEVGVWQRWWFPLVCLIGGALLA
jgi:hypothetical protein